MFSKAKSKEAATPREVTEAQDAETLKRSATAKQAPRQRPAGRPGVPSIISADVVITGKMEADGEVQFDGVIDGDLHAKGLVIGEGARVNGAVVAEKVRVCGAVEGEIRAVEVELAATALVHGDITHTSLQIESGARFDGNCRHSDDPMTASAPIKKTSTPRSAPLPPPGQASMATDDADVPSEIVDEPETMELAEAKKARSQLTARNETVDERPLVKRPATANLR
ncbi:polymer-forming cytoskeletal protein [Parvularcula sp. LCG005]|uniref:bactofilin family protein n=1 Tax=Parvularcula sp. LCG005 TaxID=3078805 RepID=UPI0029431A27|nr:polymer-forming cytoskeletal protein [Parvularcula sp. LCG005]WOI54108.1 polymer-forming cytoskeletal protein [Parvularcula sp. LCG005]